ncbi:telomeric repeat-binding factor 1 [Osmerus eperlanus]|uniref:telomeric repeat-binding factor 1 n=1 Tax=Osmerus eperlanus TaxID=29151 RepID=UPI002E14D5DF
MAADTSHLETPSTDDDMVEFSKVTTLCKRWMIDFHFVSMCRYFKEDKLEEFEKTVINLDSILESMPLINFELSQKRSIAGFVTRVMHGKDLDVHYDGVEVTPLISAINIWKLLKETVADDRLFEDITNLLYVQSVAVCLEMGQCSMASTVLKWLLKECEIPQNLGIKLSSIIKRKDTYHSYLLNFSFARLLDAILNFLQAYLKLHPCDFLLKAANKVVKACPDQLEDSGTEESETQSQSTSESTPVTQDNKETPVKRPKKKLLSTKNELLWKPESGKKPVVVLRRIGNGEDGDRLQSGAASPARPELKSRGKRKWTALQDLKIIEGVDRYGEGKWSKILLFYDFGNRTGVMLKDRWRILKKHLMN